MSQLDARLGRGYSSVGVLDRLPAMLALDERDGMARALCVDLARVTDGRPLQWRMVRLIGPAVGQDEAAVAAAIAYAVEQDSLIAGGNLAHSICLSEPGRTPSVAQPRRSR